jgi:glucokinase
MQRATEQSDPVVVAVDVGGTELKGAVVGRGPAALAELREPTGAEDGPDAVLDRLSGLLERLRGLAAGHAVAAAGVAVPGIVDDATGTAVWSANLGWRDVPLAPRLEAALGLPVAVGHDVRAGALAEGAVGAARDARDWLFLPVGTGISAALSLDGRPHAASPYAGEIGHVVVDPDGPPCACGARGCLEAIASARAIGVRYGERTHAGAVRAEEVARRAAAGDEDARAVWSDAVEALAGAIAWSAGMLALELVVVGGGLSSAGDALLEPLAAAVAADLTYQPSPRIVPAALGDRAGCLGAAMLAWERAEGASR